MCTDAFIIDLWGECGHKVSFTCMKGQHEMERVCVEGCSGGGRVAVICSVGRACGDVTHYVCATSGRAEMHQDICERKMTRHVRGSV